MSSSPTVKTRNSRRRWPRRVVFFLGWLACVGLSCLLLVGGAYWLLARHPTGVFNASADMFAPHLGLKVEQIDVDTAGRVEVRGLVMQPEGLEQPTRIEELSIGYSKGSGPIWKTGRIDSLVVQGGSLAINDPFLERFAPASEGEGGTQESADGSLPAWLDRALPAHVEIHDLQVAVDLEALPQLEARVEFSSDSLYELVSGAQGAPPQHLELHDGRWRSEGDEPVRFDELKLDVGLLTGGDDGVLIESLDISGLKAELSREHLARFLDRPDDGGGGEVPRIAIRRMRVTGAELGLSGFEQLQDLDLSAKVGFELHDLEIADGRLGSASKQSLVLNDVVIAAPGTKDAPILKWERAELAAVPDELLESGRVQKVHLRGLEIDVSKATLGDLPDRLAQLASSASDAGDEPGAPAGPARPPVMVEDLRLEPARLSFDPAGIMEGFPAVKGTLQARTEGEAPEGDIAYAFELTELALRENAQSSSAFAGGGHLLAEFTALGLQERGEIRKVSVAGLRAEIGEDVQRLIEAAEAAAGKAVDLDPPAVEPPPGAEADEGDGPQLRIVELDIDDTVVTLHDLVPKVLPRLPISIDTALSDVPLLGRSRGDEREQRIEIKGVQIASPYNTLQNVAELKTVWIHFTMAGLFRNEIKRIEVVSPDLYVGEPLFWYVDYARRFAAGKQNDGEQPAVASVTGPGGEPGNEGEPGGGEGEEESGDAIVEGLKGFELAGWRVGEFLAHSGRIIIAPTGVPLGIVPFPFDARTDFSEGKVEINVQVPTGDYTFENLELEFQRLEGKAFVNYPVAAKDNNFVQTFEAPLVKFKQFDAQNVWLSVTYDQDGIYGQLGGEAYGGYLNGAFNLYVAGPFKWDAWVSGDGFSLGDFTDVLAPQHFLMSGKMNGKFVADGQEFSIAKATGTATTGAGTMHVIKLDELKEVMPEAWDPLWQVLAAASIDAFRDYHFGSGTAEVEYAGSEGEASIVFQGDEGVRDMRIKLHDGDKEQAERKAQGGAQ